MNILNKYPGAKIWWKLTSLCSLGLVTLFFYNNCTTQGTVDSKKTIVAQLDTSDLEMLKAADGDISCADTQIFCRRFIFGSDLENSNDLKPYCFDSKVTGEEVCVQVYEFHYDSSKAVSTQNYEEAYCYNFDVNHAVGKELRHHANHIEDAIEKTLGFCKESL